MRIIPSQQQVEALVNLQFTHRFILENLRKWRYMIYDEYCPILLKQFKSREYDGFQTFDDALDEFYSKIESQRVNLQQKAKEDSAVHRLNKIKLDQVRPISLSHLSLAITLITIA